MLFLLVKLANLCDRLTYAIVEYVSTYFFKKVNNYKLIRRALFSLYFLTYFIGL
jgi:hypothetical protein